MLKAMAGIALGEHDKELAQLKRRVPAADYAVFAEPGRLRAFGTTIRECMRQGTRGAVWDMRLDVREFGFRLDEICTPLKWFHGEQDMNSPVALARKVIAELPHAKLQTYANEAHLSTLCNHFDEIARALREPA